MLEAGCGIFDHMGLPTHWHLTGLDISREALDGNDTLDERIEGDLQNVQLPPEYDLVICWDVLEHLPDPGAALSNMAAALRPGGMLVIGVPLRTSYKGWMTRLLPFWFHVLYYRHVLRWEHAGEPGHRPFYTYHRPAMGPDGIRQTLSASGLEEVWGELYATEHYRDILQAHGFASWLARIGAALGSLLTLGNLDRNHSEYVGVHRRPKLS